MKMGKKMVFCLLVAFIFAGISTIALAAETDKININTATAEELMQLQKIGQKKAENIIDYRTQNGPFTSIEDLKKVKGIGDSIFDLNKDRISIDLPETDPAAKKAEPVKSEKVAEEVPAKPGDPTNKTDAPKK